MKRTLPTRAMREHPDLDQLKRQAKELLEAFHRRRARCRRRSERALPRCGPG